MNVFDQRNQEVGIQVNNTDNVYVVAFSGSNYLHDAGYTTTLMVFGVDNKEDALNVVAEADDIYDRYRRYAEVYSMQELKSMAGKSRYIGIM